MPDRSRVHYPDLIDRFAVSGLSVRGGFVLAPEERVGALAGIGTVVLIGNCSASFWPAFEAGRRDEADPLDAWTRRVVAPVAAAFDCLAVYPSDRPYHPFQQWAQRAEPVHASPLGILIHPHWGLWHAYRAALLVKGPVAALPERAQAPSPCDSCRDKPCLTACPVNAFDGARYDVAACGKHLLAGGQPRCADLGCRARDACPVVPEMRYPDDQIRFHMAAFVRSRQK